MDVNDLTREPARRMFCGVDLTDCMTSEVQKEWNRLRHLRDVVFPLLDGPIDLLDIASGASDNTFISLLYADDRSSLHVPERIHARVGGILRRNVLYKLLPKVRAASCVCLGGVARIITFLLPSPPPCNTGGLLCACL